MKIIFLVLAFLACPVLSSANSLPCAFMKVKPATTNTSFTEGGANWDTLQKVCQTYIGICPTQAEIDAARPTCISENLKRNKIAEIKAEGLRRIRVVDDSISNVGEAIRYAKNLSRWLADGKTLTADELSVLAVAEATRDAIIVVKAYITDAEIIAYNPNWP